MRSRSYISADFLGEFAVPGGRPEQRHTKRQRFFRPVSRRKTAAFDLTTLWCCAVATTFRRWLDLRRRN
jgi:hypothetical protein